MELPKNSGSSSDLYEQTPTVSHLRFFNVLAGKYWSSAMGVRVYPVHEHIVLIYRTHEHSALYRGKLGICDVVWKNGVVRSRRL